MHHSSFARRTVRKALLPVAATLTLTLLLAACGALGGHSKSPSMDYTGTWRGTLTDEANGAGTFVATLGQTELSLAGTWHSVIAADAGRQDGGQWSGEVFVGKSADVLEVTLTPAVAGACSYLLTLSREQESMKGNYVATTDPATCQNLTRGTLQLSKQP